MGGNGRRPAPFPQLRGAYWLSGSDNDCPWCQRLLLADSERCGQGAQDPPPSRIDPSCRRCRMARWPDRIRAVTVPLAAIITVVAAVVTEWRTCTAGWR